MVFSILRSALLWMVEGHSPVKLGRWFGSISLSWRIPYSGPFMYEARFEAVSITDMEKKLEQNYREIVLPVIGRL
jgi:hypothetical protein